jgi:hypothetical protein
MCVTRYQIEEPLTAYLTHFDANWILQVEVDAADERLPFTAGQRVAFAIHSPVQVLHDPAEEAGGRRYTLSVELREDGRPEWITLQRASSAT